MDTIDKGLQSAGYEPFHFTSRDGLKLAGRKYGWAHRDKPAVVCLPGLTRNADDFHDLALYLANHEKAPRRVLSLDMRGRGKSEYDRDWRNYSPLTEASDIADAVVAAGLGHVDIVATSRGGLNTFVLGTTKPTMLGKVVLNDVGPVLEGKGLVRIRAYLERLKTPASFATAAEALKAVGSAYFPGRTQEDWIEEAKRVYRENDGKLVHTFDTNLVKTLKEINIDQPLPSLWPQFEGLRHCPMLVLRGANSDLLSKETVREMEKRHPKMQSVEVAEQGHAPDLGKGALPEIIHSFLAS